MSSVSMFRVAICAALLATLHAKPAEADEPPTWDTVGVHLYTKHGGRPKNDVNPGVFARRSDGLVLGAYCNSYSRVGPRAWDRDADRCQVSAYAGWVLAETDRRATFGASLQAAAVFGYGKRSTARLDLGPLGEHPVTLTIAPTLRAGPVGLTIISHKTFHLSAAWSL